MSPYQERVLDEREDLDQKIDALCTFLGYSNHEANRVEASLLAIQLEAMKTYSMVLSQRINSWNRQ